MRLVAADIRQPWRALVLLTQLQGLTTLEVFFDEEEYVYTLMDPEFSYHTVDTVSRRCGGLTAAATPT